MRVKRILRNCPQW
uniref:Truncated envelope glycoprotein n=1 Tax=Human immunodeficiency virus type 1 TaxID=11676 RepID=Q3S5G9_HV1|nr:truncated envelope glycoprotein [Human immunodeficiency virus 1]